MKKNKILNLSLLLLVVVILGVFALWVRVGATADSVVVLKTSGMSCSACVSKVNKALQSQKGVAATEVDLEGGWVMAGYDSKQVTPGTLANKVRECGFDSAIQSVMTPAQFKKVAGHDIGKGVAGGCCGSGGCCPGK